MNQINKTNQFEHPAEIIVGDSNCSPACEEVSVRLHVMIRGPSMSTIMLVGLATLWCGFVSVEKSALATEPAS